MTAFITFSSIMLAALTLVTAPVPGQAQVSCSSPDDLCTGDPCVIGPMEVDCPCIVDFGPRTVVISGPLELPDACIFELTAGAIQVQAVVDGSHVGRPGVGSGAAIKLNATGNVNIGTKINVSGSFDAGNVTVIAGGDVNVGDRITARATGRNATTDGGTVTITAGGKLESGRHGIIDVRGVTKATPGGQVTLIGAGDVTLAGKIKAEGNVGGVVAISSSGGGITVGNKIEAPGRADLTMGFGGLVALDAQGGNLAISHLVNVDGQTSGGLVDVRGASDVVANGMIKARARGGPQDEVTGGSVTIDAQGMASINRKIDVRAKRALLTSVGGSITINAQGAASVGGSIQAGGETVGGSLSLRGASIAIGKVKARGVSGGTLCLESTAGDVALHKSLDVREAGVIEAEAVGGTVAALGRLRVGPGGCIGLSPMPTSCTCDVAPVASCGVCP